MTVNLGTGTHTFPAYPGKIVGDLISLPTTTLTRPPRRVLGRLPALILQKLGEIPICFAHSSILSDPLLSSEMSSLDSNHPIVQCLETLHPIVQCLETLASQLKTIGSESRGEQER